MGKRDEYPTSDHKAASMNWRIADERGKIRTNKTNQLTVAQQRRFGADRHKVQDRMHTRFHVTG